MQLLSLDLLSTCKCCCLAPSARSGEGSRITHKTSCFVTPSPDNTSYAADLVPVD